MFLIGSRLGRGLGIAIIDAGTIDAGIIDAELLMLIF